MFVYATQILLTLVHNIKNGLSSTGLNEMNLGNYVARMYSFVL
jgi:hypothetical protein